MFMTLAWAKPAIRSYAIQNNAVIITKDEDFVIRASVNEIGPPVVWVRIGNVGKQALLHWIKPMLPFIIREIEAGEKLVELI